MNRCNHPADVFYFPDNQGEWCYRSEYEDWMGDESTFIVLHTETPEWTAHMEIFA